MNLTQSVPGPRRLQAWLEAALDLVFPSRCSGCGRPGPVWCARCDAALERFTGRVCVHCGLPLVGRRVCPSCRVTPPALPIRSYARYRGPLVRGLLHLKYRPNQALARVMGSWLAGVAKAEGWTPSRVVPVPLGDERRRHRGYNQAALIAIGLAEKLDVPMVEGALRRVRETRSQVGLDSTARHVNVQGAFWADPAAVGGEVVCLVDDLCTTGATLSACARAASDSGAAGVLGLTVGRA